MSVGLTIHASRNKCFARRSGDPAPYGPHGRRESTRSARRPTHSSRLTPHASRNKSFAQRTRSARRPTHNSQLTIHNSYFDSAQHKQLSRLTIHDSRLIFHFSLFTFHFSLFIFHLTALYMSLTSSSEKLPTRPVWKMSSFSPSIRTYLKS